MQGKDSVEPAFADAAGFDVEKAYDEHGRLAYAIALRIVGDPTTAEDVVQEAYVSMWRRRALFNPHRGSTRSWVCAVVRNEAIDGIRRRARMRGSEHGFDDFAAVAASDPPVSDVVVSADEAVRVRRALGALSSTQRQVLELAYFGGHSQTQISARTGAALGTVKSRTRLALLAMREAMTEKSEPTRRFAGAVGCIPAMP